VAHELGTGHLLDLVDDETLASDHAPMTHVEDLHGGFELVVDYADRVEVVGLLGDQLLLVDGPSDTVETVPDTGRELELQGLRRVGHLRLKTLHQRVGLAVEEVDEVSHQSVVGGFRDLADARA
jgi:hypothetical protein